MIQLDLFKSPTINEGNSDPCKPTPTPKAQGKPNKWVFPMSEEIYQAHRDEYDGFCVACGHLAMGGTEPDARAYRCDSCHKRQVYGMEELLFMGRLDISNIDINF